MKNIKTFVSGLLTGIIILGFSNTISAGSLLKKIEAYIVDQPIVVNGEQAKLKNPVLTYNNTRYVNLRDLSTLLGSDIEYSNGVIKLTNEVNSSTTEDNQVSTNPSTESEADNGLVTAHEKYSKYGFEEVYLYNGKEYIRVTEAHEKLMNTLCFDPDIRTQTLSIRRNDFKGDILISNAPFLTINNAWCIDYDYYVNTILPLAD